MDKTTDTCIKCASVKEKLAFEMVLLDAIKKKSKDEEIEVNLSMDDFEKSLIKSRMLSLNVAREILCDENNSGLLSLLKNEVSTRQTYEFKSATIYPDTLMKSNDFNLVKSYLKKLFFTKKNFPIFSFIKGTSAVCAFYENEVTSIHILKDGRVTSYYDKEDSLKTSFSFIRVITNNLRMNGFGPVLTYEVEKILRTHSAMLKIVTKEKLAALLDYANEGDDYDDVYHICDLLRSGMPLSSWPHDMYEIVTNVMTYEFSAYHKNEYIKDLIKKYFYELQFLK